MIVLRPGRRAPAADWYLRVHPQVSLDTRRNPAMLRSRLGVST